MSNSPNILEECSIKVPNRLDYISIIQNYTKDVATKYNLDPKSIQQVEVAVEEAATNVVKHAFHINKKNEYNIICQKEPDRVVIRIRDKGIPFDPTQLSEYNPDTPLTERTAAGLGSFLIRKMVDLYEYNNLGKDGKETVLIKYLSQEGII